MKRLIKNSGFTLVEMVIYVAILSVISFLIVNVIISFTASYKTIAILRSIDSSAVNTMERISRDIRLSKTIDDANSTFGSNPGVLTLTSDSGGTTKTTKFYLSNGTVKVDVDGVYFGPLSVSKTTVNNLTFTKIDNTISDSIKIDMTISGTYGNTTKTKSYHTTVVAKGF